MKSLPVVSAAVLLAPWLFGAQNASSGDPKYETRTSVGRQMPAFSIRDTTGRTFDTQALKGRVVLVNFWATWCPPCRAELPRLEKEIWEKYKSDKFVVIAIGREETEDAITKYAAEHGLTFRIAADPKRAVYSLFASAGIPRTYVVDRNGKIVFQSAGFEESEFERLKQVVAEELSGGRTR